LFITGFIAGVNNSYGQCGTIISAFPYHEDFETSDGGWISGGTYNDWIWGTPSKPVISNAGSGSKCWITGGLVTSFYNYSERSFVQSPCFDFSALTNPHIILKIFWETENTYDGSNLQYSTNGGVSWSNVGAYNDPVDCMNDNWYNYASVNNLSALAVNKNGWCGNIQPSMGSCVGGGGSGVWIIAKHTMPYLGGEPSVIFRVTFGAGTTCNSYDGFAFDDIKIENAAEPLAISETLQPAGCTVNDGSAILNVSGGISPYTYLWNPNVSTTNTASGLSTGNYNIVVTDLMGCSKVNTITILNTPAVTFSVVAYADTCGRNVGAVSMTVQTGTAPFSYLWSTGETSSALNNLSPDSYTVTVTDAEGCSLTSELLIESVGFFTIDLGHDSTICNGNSFQLSPGTFTDYTWQDSVKDSIYIVSKPGIYSVEVTNAGGCKASDTIEVTEDCFHDILVPNAFSPNEDGINDIFLAKAVHVESLQMEIYNRWGEKIFESTSIQQGWNGNIAKSKCQTGIYLWVIKYSMDGIEQKEKSGIVFLLR
jgi:gliding motility-associated-like protein